MDQVPQRLARWWSGLDGQARRHASVLALISLGYIVHYLVYCIPQPFFIEDAAISFAYAKNLVLGEGLVPFAGGERVEGYSNATWTLLVAAFYALGVPTFTSSKILGAVFGVATLPIAYDLVRRARPGQRDDVALAAPLLLAASTQFVIWNASGLENSLFCLLLAAGTRRLLQELEPLPAEAATAHRPWSALLFFLLSATRPEAVAYAVFALVALGLDAAATRRLAPTLRWLPAFILPFVAYNLWRYSYFAWEFPNTYYAKLALQSDSFQPWNWSGGGWKYVRNWFGDHHVGWVLPLLGLAMAGFAGWRRWFVVVAAAWLALTIGWDGREGLDRLPDWWRPVQREWVEIRVWSIAAITAALGLITLGRPGWRSRGLLWISASFAVFFAHYSKGDWMRAHRWFNLAAPTLLPLLAIGLGELLDALRLDRWRLRAPDSWAGKVPEGWLTGLPLRGVLLGLPLVAWVGSEAVWANDFANSPETATRDIHRRVRYMTWVQRRLDLDHVTLIDVDMGAHLYFTDWRIIDIAGLVDVPIARHRDFDMDFMREYVFEEANPEFAHVHSGWARASKIPKHKEWKDRYIEIPGYPIGGMKLHVGSFIRKDIFVHDQDGPLPDDAQRFGGGIRLVSARLPAPEVAAGGLLSLHTRWQAGFRRQGFRILAVLDDGAGHRSIQALPTGYDWYHPKLWKTREVVESRFRVPVPADLPTGEYKVYLLLLDEKSGETLPWLGSMGEYRSQAGTDREAPLPADDAADETAEGTESAETPPPPPPATRTKDGALDTGLVFHIVSAAEAEAAAAADLATVAELAAAGDCEGAWEGHKDATRHVLRDTDWAEAQAPASRRIVARCLVARADAAEPGPDRVAALIEARRWDRHLPELLARSRPLAAELDARGDALFAEERWAEAYDAFAKAVALDPRRSWSRRKAEDARDLKLDIIRPGRERPEDAAAEPPTLDGRAATVGRKGRALPLAPEDGPEDEDEPGAEAPGEGADAGN